MNNVNILYRLSEGARKRCNEAMKVMSLEDIIDKAMALPTGDFAFERALRKDDIAFICECKKASPSKGIIAEEYPYREIAMAYEEAGADCISVLTEPDYFLGSLEHLRKVCSSVSIPVIRKDFTVNEYMIYEARLCGASAVLLICSILGEETIARYIEICDSLGMSALVEAHDEQEVMIALNAGARVIGVNNRNLKDFTVDTSNSRRLRELVPDNVIFVSESGVKTAEDVELLRQSRCNAALVGETLMRAEDKNAKLAELKGRIATYG